MTDTSTDPAPVPEEAPEQKFASMTLQITWLGMGQPTAPAEWKGKGYLVRSGNGQPIAACRSWTEACDFMKKTLETEFR
jgi:hypothetical protein